MKILRYKKYRKYLQFYKINFGLEEPYKILVDGLFIKYSLDHKTYFKDLLPKIMHGKTTPVVTRCMVSDMRSKGEAFLGAALLAKRLKHVACEHKTPVSSNECILSLLQNEKYCLASMDETLLAESLKLPHVPVVLYENNVMLLRKPSKIIRQKIYSELEKNKLAKEDEIVLANEIRKKQKEEEKQKKTHITNYVTRVLNQKKKAKGPNPLSVKKKKPKKIENNTENKASIEDSENKEKRKRKRKRSKTQSSDDQSMDPKLQEEDKSNDNECEAMMPQKKKRKRKRKKKSETESNEEEIQLNNMNEINN